MRTIALLALLLLNVGDAPDAAIRLVPHAQGTAAMRALPLNIGGRVAPVGGFAKGWVHRWPGTYFEGAFRGNRVVVRFADKVNDYRLIVDDLMPLTLSRPGRDDIAVGGLGTGPHRIRVEKVTDATWQPAVFGGLFVPRDATPLAPPKRRLQIEYIGDSSMTGYGDRSPSRDCTGHELLRRTDTQSAYPAAVARHFDADYQINAVSGSGLIRNYKGDKPDQTLQRLYPFTLLDGNARYADPRWRPRVVVIRLVADFTGTIGANERWTDFHAVARDYGAAMAAFVRDLKHRHAADATLLVWWLDMTKISDPEFVAIMAEAQDGIRSAAKDAGFARVDFPIERDLGFDYGGCHYHMSLADHAKMTAWMVDYLARIPGFDQPPGGGAGERR